MADRITLTRSDLTSLARTYAVAGLIAGAAIGYLVGRRLS